MNKALLIRLIALALLMTSFATELMAADAGSVLFSKGNVTAQRDAAVSLAKGDAVLATDTVATGDASRAQLLMIDGAKIAIRPNSEIRIDEYSYAAAAPTVVEQSDDKSVISLVKGGFRTITGAIGEENKSNYEVRTPVGVLGIRGTNFAILLCGGDCTWAPNVNPGEPIEDGLYIGVTEGVIDFRAEGGEIVVRAGEYAFIPMASRVPEKLNGPPSVLFDDNDMRFDADSGATQSGFDSKLGTRRSPESTAPKPDSEDPNNSSDPEAPKQPVIGIDADGTPIDITPGESPRAMTGRMISFATGPLGAVDTIFSGTQFNNPSQLQMDSGNNLVGFQGPYPGRAIDEPADFGIGTSGNVDLGFDSMTVLRWGRWSGGVASGTLQSDGSDVSVDLGSQSLHWISGADAGAPVMPITGTAAYTLIGATSPTDNLGNTGVLGSATFNADFTNLRVDSTLVIDIGGLTWAATGNGTMGAAIGIPAHMFVGTYGAVVVGGMTGGSGDFTGFFSDAGATSDPSFPGGVGLTYSLQDGQGTITVSGAAAFGNP
jgi:hypothetical protein